MINSRGCSFRMTREHTMANAAKIAKKACMENDGPGIYNGLVHLIFYASLGSREWRQSQRHLPP